MSQELVTLLSLSSHVLVYATGNLVINGTAETIAKTNAFTGITTTVTDCTPQVVLASSEDAGNDGTHTLTAATASLLTTSSDLTTNADDDSMTVKGRFLSRWYPVSQYSRIIGLISSDQDITFTTTWSNAASGAGLYTVTTAITGGTAASIDVTVLGPFVRFAGVNNDNTHATATIAMYAKALT